MNSIEKALNDLQNAVKEELGRFITIYRKMPQLEMGCGMFYLFSSSLTMP